MVVAFDSTTAAKLSAPFEPSSENKRTYMNDLAADVVIGGNTVTLTHHPRENVTVVNVLTVTAIPDTDFTADRKATVTVDGVEEGTMEDTVQCSKTDEDYDLEIIGTWEGRRITGDAPFDDGKGHRFEYKADGTYAHYVKDGDEWVPSTDVLNEYFVTSDLLCHHWTDGNEEHAEGWDLTIDGDNMIWTALRKDENGEFHTMSFELERVR